QKHETPLIIAAKYGYFDLVRILLLRQADPNVQDDQGNTALYYAVDIQNKGIINVLVLDRNHSLLNQTNNKKENALIIATKLHCDKVVRVFLEYHANINQQDIHGNTALHYAVQMNILDIINDLTYSQANITIKNNEGHSILLRSCMENSNEKVIKWLLTMNINPYIIDSHGMTALMYAARNPSLEFVVRYFIDMNNEKVLSQVDNNGENVLFHAIYNLKVFKLLVKTSIDINHRNNDQDTVLLYCCKHEDARFAIPFLVNHPELDVNIPDKEGMTTPLYLVENGGRIEIIKSLLRLGADVNHQDHLGNTALYYAVDLDDMQSIQILAFYKADLHIKN
ncbi:hypothetical protein PIROE2DRAFT_30584, partial [Piromyces sp. E2]